MNHQSPRIDPDYYPGVSNRSFNLLDVLKLARCVCRTTTKGAFTNQAISKVEPLELGDWECHTKSAII